MTGGKPPAHPTHHPTSLMEDGAPASEPFNTSKFVLTWPAKPPLPFQTPLGHTIKQSGTISSSDGELDLSGREYSLSSERYSHNKGGDCDVAMIPHFKTQQPSLPLGDQNPDPQRLPCIFLILLPSLEHLTVHKHRFPHSRTWMYYYHQMHPQTLHVFMSSPQSLQIAFKWSCRHCCKYLLHRSWTLRKSSIQCARCWYPPLHHLPLTPTMPLHPHADGRVL